jgi:VIT1/CCC1 family predicted Fe2+/Mn2+ transporter
MSDTAKPASDGEDSVDDGARSGDERERVANDAASLVEHALAYQRNEITEHEIYKRLAGAVKSPENARVLRNIAADELRHYREWRRHTGRDVRPVRWRVWFYYGVSRLLGLTFGIKLMERGEEGAQTQYARWRGVVADADAIVRDEHDHEEALIGMLDEERLRYMGSIVLGLNDALVELTGGLAGLTLALGATRLIALSGLVVGIAAALSMAASGYLSAKAEKTSKAPLRAAFYTGAAYVFTVVALILPYLVLSNPYVCLACALGVAVLIIAAFNYYISVATGEPFRRQFVEMVCVSLGVAALSFGAGYVLRAFLGVEE